MHLTPESGGADIREMDHAIAGIAVQFRGGNLLRFKAFQQRVKYRMCQAEWAINRLFNIAVKRLTGNRLDDKSKQHIIDIAVDMFAAGLIFQRRALDHLQRLAFILGI